jgi:hypothetical protein
MGFGYKPEFLLLIIVTGDKIVVIMRGPETSGRSVSREVASTPAPSFKLGPSIALRILCDFNLYSFIYETVDTESCWLPVVACNEYPLMCCSTRSDRARPLDIDLRQSVAC